MFGDYLWCVFEFVDINGYGSEGLVLILENY